MSDPGGVESWSAAGAEPTLNGKPITAVFTRASGAPLPPWREETQESADKFWNDKPATQLDKNVFDPENNRQSMKNMAIKEGWPGSRKPAPLAQTRPRSPPPVVTSPHHDGAAAAPPASPSTEPASKQRRIVAVGDESPDDGAEYAPAECDVPMVPSTAYQQCARAIDDEEATLLAPEIVQKAMMDVLTSDHPAAGDALSYLLSAGFPTVSAPDQTPFVLVAAQQLETNYDIAFDHLALLAEYDADFNPAMALLHNRLYESIMAKANLSAGPL